MCNRSSKKNLIACHKHTFYKIEIIIKSNADKILLVNCSCPTKLIVYLTANIKT